MEFGRSERSGWSEQHGLSKVFGVSVIAPLVVQILLVLLFIIDITNTATATGQGAYDLFYNSNTSTITAHIYSQIETNATSQAEFEEFLSKNTIIVFGSNIDLGERLLFETVRLQNSWLGKVPESWDTYESRRTIESGRYALAILIGGPQQNNITAYGITAGWFNETSDINGTGSVDGIGGEVGGEIGSAAGGGADTPAKSDGSGGFGGLELILKSGKLANHTVVLAFSDKRGYESEPGSLKRESVDHSPLNAFMPKEYIPVAATGISMILLAVLNIGRTVFEFKALDIGRKNKKVGEGAWMVNGINLTEVLAILGASLVLGVSISWQYFGFGPGFASWLAINTIICLFAAILHEVTHRILAYFFKIKMEYRFWPAGSLLTLVSSYLGNAFSVQAFILEDISPQTEKWKVGLMKLAAPVISAIFMVVFAVLNFSSPSPLYAMISSISGLWAMAEILPFGSLDGKDVKEWSSTVWFISFVLIGASYFIVTFLL